MESNKRPRETEEARCRYLRFTNLPHGCTAGELNALLEPLGKVEDCRVARASSGGMLALVEMSCTREATSAKRRLSEMPLRGSALTVSFDSSRSEAPLTGSTAIGSTATVGGGGASGGGGDAKAGDSNSVANKAPMPLPPRGVEAPPYSSKLPPFYVPDRMAADVYENRVIKMRSVLWTAREDDIRQFYRGLVLDRDAVEMGRDHAGRFSGMVYVRLRSAADANSALRRGADTLCGRSVIMSRLDVTTPGIFRPGGYDERGMPPPAARDSSARGNHNSDGQPLVEPRPWPERSASASAAPAAKPPPAAPGHVGVHLTVGPADKGQAPSLQKALATAPVGDALAAVRHFLSQDARLPLATRNAAQFLDALRTRILEDPAQSSGDASKGASVARHLFRSPFEVAGVHGYSMPEVEHVFGTRSSDSVFWPIFSTFHTLLPHEVDEPTPDESLDDFVGGT